MKLRCMYALNSGKVISAGFGCIWHGGFCKFPIFTASAGFASRLIVGWNSEGAMTELQRKTAQNVVTALIERRPKYSVNLGALKK
jgi:hypothetical protein